MGKQKHDPVSDGGALRPASLAPGSRNKVSAESRVTHSFRKQGHTQTRGTCHSLLENGSPGCSPVMAGRAKRVRDAERDHQGISPRFSEAKFASIMNQSWPHHMKTGFCVCLSPGCDLLQAGDTDVQCPRSWRPSQCLLNDGQGRFL